MISFIQSITNIFIILYFITLMAITVGFFSLTNCESGRMCGAFLGWFSFPLFLLSSIAFLIHITAYINLLKTKSLFFYTILFSSITLFTFGANGEFMAATTMLFYSTIYIGASFWFVNLQNESLKNS